MHRPSLLTRRDFLARTSLATAALLTPLSGRVFAEPQLTRMTLCLSPGSIGVNADQRTTIALAAKYGFTSVEPFASFLAALGEGERAELVADLKAKNLVFGPAGLPVDFRGDDARFQQGLRELPRQAAALQKSGATRIGTWISPGSGNRTYLANFKLHQQRLTEVARVLKDHGLRFGLEYVGTPSARARSKHPFIHSLPETRELIAAISTGNVGVILDSWHWWTAGDSEADLLALRNEDVISVDLNDAPAGLTLEQQQDGQRELPAATGVIPVATFFQALQKIGCDAPIRAEPFNKKLNDLPNDEACAATIAALRKAMATLESGAS